MNCVSIFELHQSPPIHVNKAILITYTLIYCIRSEGDQGISYPFFYFMGEKYSNIFHRD